jgi:uncharacterized lipoprotein
MKNNRLKLLITSVLLATVTACSTAPTHLIVTPQVQLPASNQFSNQEAKITVVDMRTSTHIVQILKEDKAATILSAEQRLEYIIKDVLTSQWHKQGLQFNATAKNDITVTIEKAIISVDQESVSYNTQSEIILKVSIDNTKQTLTSRFKNRAHSEGALKADIAVLEREFNQHLSTLLKQILTSKDINNFL